MVEDLAGLMLPADPTARAFDQLGVVERCALLSGAAWLLADWPTNFIESARRSQTGISTLLAERHPLPYWYSSVVEDQLNLAGYVTTDAEVKAGIKYYRARHVRPIPMQVRKLLGVGDLLRKHPKRRTWFRP